MIKKLYQCNAYYTIDEINNRVRICLVSYSTKVVEIKCRNINHNANDIGIKTYRYPSDTTAQHIRKFIKLLKTSKEFLPVGEILERLIDCLVRRRFNFGIYACGTVWGINADYKMLKRNGFEFGQHDLQSYSY